MTSAENHRDGWQDAGPRRPRTGRGSRRFLGGGLSGSPTLTMGATSTLAAPRRPQPDALGERPASEP